MKMLYRKALPTGARTMGEYIWIKFPADAEREYVDQAGILIDKNSLSLEDLEALAIWEDIFEDGYNEFDGTYEISRGASGCCIRRRAELVQDPGEAIDGSFYSYYGERDVILHNLQANQKTIDQKWAEIVDRIDPQTYKAACEKAGTVFDHCEILLECIEIAGGITAMLQDSYNIDVNCKFWRDENRKG